jgi:hypothetical protein
VRAGLSWWAFIRRSKSLELPVVPLEDVGALLGLGCALVGVSLAVVTGGVPLRRGRECRDRAAARRHRGDPWDRDAQPAHWRGGQPGRGGRHRAALIDGPAVRRLIHLRTLHLGPDELLVGAKVEFDPVLSLAEAAEAIDEAERRVRAMVPSARIIYLEPDCYRAEAPVEPASAPDP